MSVLGPCMADRARLYLSSDAVNADYRPNIPVHWVRSVLSIWYGLLLDHLRKVLSSVLDHDT